MAEPLQVELKISVGEGWSDLLTSLAKSSAPPSEFDPVQYLAAVDPQWLEAEALIRETFGGKSFTENVLDVLREVFSARDRS